MTQVSRKQLVWQVVSTIPPGQVATYGQVAQLAGLFGQARYVGYALGQLPAGHEIPWYRVINSQGRISFPQGTPEAMEQAQRLRMEGVEVRDGKISLRRFGWEP
ncbi:MGMT family protein [Mangrovitalea sediminis]|uniref:MGMT family protein n=1 Tax=Mangrovitalea sediminis TaxID=1982043 RepID=UPI000BE56F79|nr:MGMT family protein [Mangrovitalea sediminis]